jgi:hypothetical protein
VAPRGDIWSAGDGFRFNDKAKKTRRSASGMACAPDARGTTVCLIAFDEGVALQFAQLDGRKLVPGHTPLLVGREGDELDAEGAATDGRYFYVTGSHAVKRSNCQANPASQHVLRIARDARTGLASSPGDLSDAGSLRPLIEALPPFRENAGRQPCLGEGGIDIEGLAVRQGRLFFALRGPTGGDGTAFIVSADADALFDRSAGRQAQPQVHRVAVGSGRGIRDMVAVADGILLLAGPDDSPSHADVPWQVLLWRAPSSTPTGASPEASPVALAVLDLGGVKLRGCDKEIKPEAMAVLAESPKAYRVLVLSDGLCDGGPLAFDLAR